MYKGNGSTKGVLGGGLMYVTFSMSIFSNIIQKDI